jgi:hypothetical protein
MEGFMVAAIKRHVTVGEDRKLVIELPPDAPTGDIEVTIQAAQPEAVSTLTPYPNPAREAARDKLLAAGVLSTVWKAPEGTKRLTPEEILELVKLPRGAKSNLDLINEDRGEY